MDCWVDPLLGGGSVLREFYVGSFDYEIESPLVEKAYDFKDRLETAYGEGQKQGGFYKI